MKRFTQLIFTMVLVLVLGMSTSNAQEVSYIPGPTIGIPLAGNNGGFSWGDVNGDGNLDLLVRQNNVMINGTTTFSQLVTAGLPTGADACGLGFADFNGDGLPDVFMVNQSGFTTSIWLNNGGISFTQMTGTGDLATAGGNSFGFGGIGAADINHSGYLSLAWAGQPGGAVIPGNNNPALPGGGIWLLKGGPTGFTNVGRGVVSGPPNPTIDFESNNVGDTLAHIGWAAADILPTVVIDPFGGTSKVLKNAINNYNAAPVLAFTLPTGKTMADYKSFTFKSYWAQGDVGYKDITVEAYSSMPTGHFLGDATAKIGSVNRAAMGSTAWENITIDITNTKSFSGTIYIAFGINCAGTGNVGGTGVQTVWYADNVTLSYTPGGGATLAIDTTLSYEAWNVSFFDANNDSYPDLLMPSFRDGFARIDTGISGSRKGTVLFLNDKTGKFFAPTGATLARTIYSIGVGNVVSTVADTGIIVDDTVRHFEALSHVFGDFNNDGNMDLVLASNGANNYNGLGGYVNVVILYGKGDGTFTYKWDGTNVVVSGIPSTYIRAWNAGDYNNDGRLDLVTSDGTNTLLRNNGDGTFTNVTALNSLSGVTIAMRSIAFVDYNNDGWLDIYTYTNTTSNLYKNNGNTTNKWFGIKPVGLGNNVSAIGARFTVYSDSGRFKQIRQITAEADAKGLGGDCWANFGLGTKNIDSVVAVWPDGVKQSWPGAAFTINSYKKIVEGSVYLPAPTTTRPSWAAGDTILPKSNTFTWSAVTGGTQPVSYTLQIGTNRTMSTILQTLTSTTNSKVATIPLATKLYWRVLGNSGMFSGVWSNVDSLRTNMTPATTVPVKISPTTNQLHLPKQPTLVCHSTPEAYIYNFQLDTVNRFAARDTLTGAARFTGLLFNDSTTVIDTTKQMSALTPNRKYYWRVRGWNAAGASAYSSVDSFTIQYLPLATSLLYPTHNQADARADTLVLRVQKVDADSNYVFQTWTYTSAGQAFRSDTVKQNPTLTLTGLLNRSKYYWQVQVGNQAGWSAFTAVDSFTTIIELASTPRTITPKNSSAEQRRTKFVWSKATNAVWYHLQVATTNFINPSDIIEDVKVQTDTTYTIMDTLKASTLYYWRVSAIDLGGEGAFSASAHFNTGTATDVEQAIQLPKAFALLQNYPNPFNPTTTIGYELPKTSFVKLYIYDVLGRVVATLVDGMQPANTYRVEWNPSRLSSGVYFCRIQARSQDGSTDFTSVKKLLYMK